MPTGVHITEEEIGRHELFPAEDFRTTEDSGVIRILRVFNDGHVASIYGNGTYQIHDPHVTALLAPVFDSLGLIQK